MAPLAQNGSQFAQQQSSNPILNACSVVNRQMGKVNELITLLQVQRKLSLDAVNDTQQRNAKNQIDLLSTEIMSSFRYLTGQVKAIKQKPEASSPKNAPQVERLSREIMKLKQSYEMSDANFRKQLESQIARQVKIVHPDASEQEVRAAIEDPESQIFSQALLQSDRQGQAQSTRNNVRQRHEEIQKIESQMIELAALFEDMNNLVIQQEDAVVNVEAKGEAIVEDMNKGVEELGVAVVSAQKARKWKWWCLGIASKSCSILIQIHSFISLKLSILTFSSAHRHHYWNCCCGLQIFYTNSYIH